MSAAARGRPARISREAILEAGVALLEEAGAASPPSLNAIARALKITPMAIYTYFASKDELWQALSDRLLAELELVIPAEADSFAQLALWSSSMRAHLLRRPQLINMLVWEGGHTSISWLRRAMAVSDALAELGFEGRELARATLWVWQVVMGAINIELRNRAVPQDLAADEFQSLDASLQGRIAVLQELNRDPAEAEIFFAYQVERMLDALRAMTPTRS